MIKIENIDSFIQHTLDYQAINPMASVQCDIGDSKNDKEFVKYLCGIADVIIPQELTGMRREETDLTHEDIIELITPKNSLKSGIKINHKPYWKIREWEEWEEGYIEGFIRICPRDKPDYFIWTYIKMDHLRPLLEKWKDKLHYYF